MEQRPETIEELKLWYVQKNLPEENVTRFFIGKDYKGARAFGIYQDEITGNFVVYKNKSDGSRSIRYEGRDEAFAVNELYKKLKDEIYNQKNNNPKNYNRHNGGYNPINYGGYSRSYNPVNYISGTGQKIKLMSPICFIAIFMILIIFIMTMLAIKSPKRGYYKYSNNYYYYQDSVWYQYNDEYNYWKRVNEPETLKDNYSEYYSSYDYSYAYNIDRFEDSGYYKEPSSYSSSSYYDYDSDYDWDSGSSWDSDYTDWDSDW